MCTRMGMSEGNERKIKIYCDILCVGAGINVQLFGVSSWMDIQKKKIIKNYIQKKKNLRHKFHRRIF